MFDMQQGGPLARSGGEEQIWMPVKHAARAAGVPERSAFRWAKKGVVQVRRSGKVQLVEVAALRAWAARPMNARVAADGATGIPGAGVAAIEQGSNRISQPALTFSAVVAADADITEQEERLCLLEVAAEEMERRMAALEGSRADTLNHG